MRTWIAIGLSVVLLVGCGTKFVYHNLDWFAIDYIEDYVDLTKEQKTILSERIVNISQWHKQQEIPLYIQQLDKLSQITPRTITVEFLHKQELEMRAHYHRLLQKIEPDIYSFAQQLSDQQVKSLMLGLEKKHNKYADRYQGLTDTEIHGKYKSRIEERVEDWLGDLQPAQQQLVQQWADSMQITAYDWINYQAQIRTEVEVLLNQRDELSLFLPRLNRLLFEPESYYSPVLASKVEYNHALSERYLVQIIQLSNDRQIQHFQNEVADWKKILIDLQS
ncbi:DUF6279 family lipoprotein [Vibrio aestuarianus]|uniref:DUF6279 family lipoprotein n=1 Tax=Vibrio aestuarianus TaxID=28171 RepID=A0A9X4J3B6_9VIBR|nr:DUF6279 family lipoprotein [Vibrio aestuarianus]MDE1311967.1 DUF6279 family lipoprotein [Vibrio aestuarianus]MDE1357724.1 DUF6279 family lipoprotein [Vibrio aestuarianus]NGZ19127.1 hypothetical protein [Vibrio aestuarianus]NGZ92791.1 hypothetical protein [Vibrio aestuarianus subsp. cardii]